MNEFNDFGKKLREIIAKHSFLGIDEARRIICEINNFLYTTHPNIGKFDVDGMDFEYFSDFHKFWHKHHQEILDCEIDDTQCELVADALHDIYLLTDGEAFHTVYNTGNLDDEQICRVRFFTANQDFRISMEFLKLVDKYESDPSIFDETTIFNDPNRFLTEIKVNTQSQNDKRIKYAKNLAKFIIDHQCSPYGIIKKYKYDLKALREALKASNSGFGNKKADMFIRDMVVLGVWENVENFEAINVASDSNTIRVALRTGIIKTKIPLLTSFMDIFGYQYSYIDDMNALAWRKVWEIWVRKYPSESIASPCLIDYFVYNVVGKQFCNNILAHYKCLKFGHIFRWHSSKNRTCQICYQQTGERVPAKLYEKTLPCMHEEGYVAIHNSNFVKNMPDDKKIDNCPFHFICKDRVKFNSPKSISIMGKTGWETAYTKTGEGGGGLMA